MIIRMNGQLLSAALPSLTDMAKDEMKDFFMDTIMTFLDAAADIFVQLSYSITLIGVGMMLLIGVTSGHKKFNKWSVVLFMVHCLITLVFG